MAVVWIASIMICSCFFCICVLWLILPQLNARCNHVSSASVLRRLALPILQQLNARSNHISTVSVLWRVVLLISFTLSSNLVQGTVICYCICVVVSWAADVVYFLPHAYLDTTYFIAELQYCILQLGIVWQHSLPQRKCRQVWKGPL